MANWLNQLQSLLGQSRSSTSSSADQGLGQTFSAWRIRRTGWAAGQQINQHVKLSYEIWHKRVTGWRRSGSGYGAVE